jgi:hypothetical protein
LKVTEFAALCLQQIEVMHLSPGAAMILPSAPAGRSTQSSSAWRCALEFSTVENVMTINEQIDDIVELQPEETKAVVGGASTAAAGAEMRRMEPAMRVEIEKMPAPRAEPVAAAVAMRK